MSLALLTSIPIRLLKTGTILILLLLIFFVTFGFVFAGMLQSGYIQQQDYEAMLKRLRERK